MYKRTKWVISLVLTLVMLFSIIETAAAAESDGPDDQSAIVAEEANSDNNPSDAPHPSEHVHNWSITWSNDETFHWHECIAEDCPVTANSQKESYGEHNYSDGICVECGYSRPGIPSVVTEDVAAPTTYQEVYNRMIALKETFPEKMPWNNLTPYGTNGTLGADYQWKGGKIYGADRGVGCAAFAFILSDAAFGILPARAISNGSFTFDDVKVGDILRVESNSHSVIVLQKSTGGVIIAEANYNQTVHWGRVMNEAEVMAANYIITRYPVDFMPSDAPEADKVEQSGTVESLSWSLTKAGILTISGSGSMPDFSPNGSSLPPWSTLDVSTVVIKEGVTNIGNYAFYQSKALSVYIPDGVKSIGQNAFQESSLMTVTIPGTVATIGSSAFRNCPNLTSVTIPEGVTVIDANAFRGCTALAYIDFPASIMSVGDGAFMDCSEMTRMRFMPGSETVTIGDNLFSRCWHLTDVTLPEKADCISSGMFAGCISLTRLYIPASVTAIKGTGELSGSPFAQCTYLYTIDFGGSEAAWNAINGWSALNYAGLTNQTTVNFNVKFDAPFATDSNDPGNVLPDDPGNPDNHPSDAPAPNSADNAGSSGISDDSGSPDNSSGTPTHDLSDFTAADTTDESIEDKTETVRKPDDSLDSVTVLAKQENEAATNSFGHDQDIYYYAPESNNAPGEIGTSDSASEEITEFQDRSNQLSARPSDSEGNVVPPQKSVKKLSPGLFILISTPIICGASGSIVHFIRKASNKNITDNAVNDSASKHK